MFLDCAHWPFLYTNENIGHPTTFFSKITVRRSKLNPCIEISKVQERLIRYILGVPLTYSQLIFWRCVFHIFGLKKTLPCAGTVDWTPDQCSNDFVCDERATSSTFETSHRVPSKQFLEQLHSLTCFHFRGDTSDASSETIDVFDAWVPLTALIKHLSAVNTVKLNASSRPKTRSASVTVMVQSRSSNCNNLFRGV